MLTLRTGLRWLHHFEDGFLVLALLSMLFMAIVQILLRNFADSGIFWAESFLRILVLWLAMLGAMVATRESNHISIDVMSRFFDPRIARWLILLTSLFSAVICFTVAYYAVEFVQYEYEDKTIAFANVPTWLCQSIIPLGFFVMSIRFVITGIKAVFSIEVFEDPAGGV